MAVVQCDLDGAVHQLVGNSSAHTLEEGGKSGRTFTVGASQFPALAAGSVLFLSSPDLVCAAAKDGRWAEETERFLHTYTLGDHGDISIYALEDLLQELQSHYEAAENQVEHRDDANADSSSSGSVLKVRSFLRTEDAGGETVTLSGSCIHLFDPSVSPW